MRWFRRRPSTYNRAMAGFAEMVKPVAVWLLDADGNMAGDPQQWTLGESVAFTNLPECTVTHKVVDGVKSSLTVSNPIHQGDSIIWPAKVYADVDALKWSLRGFERPSDRCTDDIDTPR
jgi:hypothetical protein